MPVEDIQGNGLEFSPDGRSLFAWRIDPRGWLTQLWFGPSLAEIAVAEGREYQNLAKDAPTWYYAGNALAKGSRAAEAVQAFREAIQLSAHQPDLDHLRKSALRRRAQSLSS